MGTVEDRLQAIADDTVVITAGFFKHLFKSELHPRAKNGQFIEKGGFVRGLFTFLKDGKHESRQYDGVVTGFTKNKQNPDDPWVLITTKQGPAIARVSDITHAAKEKAKLPPPPKTFTERLAEQKAKVNAAADELSVVDPAERMRGLDKIMGGVRGSPLSTAYQYNKRGKTGDEWDPVRMNQHEVLWRRILDDIEQAHIPANKQALLLGGLPGSGKSSSLLPGQPAGELGVIAWDGIGPIPEGVTHFVLNPDNIKAMMIDEGMLPEGISDKIKPNEQASFIHAESNFLTAMFFRRMAELGHNVVYDTTMANVPHVKKNVGPLHDAGYDFKGVYIDIPREESRLSTTRRYLTEWESPMGGRFVPSEATGNNTRGVFEDMTQWMNEWLIVDNTGISKGTPRLEIVKRGTEPIVRPAPPKRVPWSRVEEDNKWFGMGGDMVPEYIKNVMGVEPDQLDWVLQTIPVRESPLGTKWMSQEKISKIKDNDVGIKTPVVALWRDGAPEIIDGSHRMEVSRQRGDKTIAAYVGFPQRPKQKIVPHGQGAFGYVPNNKPASGKYANAVFEVVPKKPKQVSTSANTEKFNADLADVIARWKGDPTPVRYIADLVIKGTPHTDAFVPTALGDEFPVDKQLREQTAALVTTVAKAPVVPAVMYRGMSVIGKTPQDMLAAYKPGNTIRLGLQGFSLDEFTARYFSHPGAPPEERTPVMVTLSAGAHAYDIGDKEYEHITAGLFQIESAQYIDGTVYIVLTQIERIKAPSGGFK